MFIALYIFEQLLMRIVYLVFHYFNKSTDNVNKFLWRDVYKRQKQITVHAGHLFGLHALCWCAFSHQIHARQKILRLCILFLNVCVTPARTRINYNNSTCFLNKN